MVTIKDIAQLTGVSQGTVSNVLNGKGNVSTEKIRLVTEAANKLGYSINAQARQLRGDSKVSNFIAVLLPNVLEIQYSTLYTAIVQALKDSGYFPLLFTTNASPLAEKELIKTLSAMRVAGVLIVSSCQEENDVSRPIVNYGGQVVYMLCRPKHSCNFIGFDFVKTGHEIADMLKKKKVNSAVLLAGLNYFPKERDFLRGFYDSCSPGMRIEILQARNDTAAHTLLQYLGQNEKPQIIVCTSITLLQQACATLDLFEDQPDCELIAITPQSILPQHIQGTAYKLDYGALGGAAARLILERIHNGIRPEKFSPEKIIESEGFGLSMPAVRLKGKNHLRVLMMRGQSGKAVMLATPQFTKLTGVSVDYTVLNPQEMDELYEHPETLDVFDVLRISGSRLPHFPLEHLQPFDTALHRDLTAGMFPELACLLSEVSDTPYTVPFDVGTHVMIYRKDLFSDPMIKRMYYEATGDSLQVPKKFDEYLQVCRFFDRKEHPSSPVIAGTSGALGTNSEIFTKFYFRYQSYAAQPLCLDNVYTFDKEAALRTIENYVNTLRCSLKISDNLYYGANLKAFIAGETAMEQMAMNYSSNIIQLLQTNLTSMIGYTEVPGGYPAPGGGGLAVARDCSDLSAALAYIRWACGTEFSKLFTYLGGVSPHVKVFEDYQILSLYPWYSRIPQNIAIAARTNLWRMFSIQKLEELVGYLIRSAYNGVLSCQAAADQLAAKISTCFLNS